MELYVGTSGFSYKAWKGGFYPEDLASGEMLGFYAERLPAVEINNTFYRLPRASVLEAWAAQVPAGFRFAVKASRRITHFKRLKDTGDETGYLLRTLGVLGERLGAVLFQLPPNLPRDLPRLDAFLALLPEGTPAAFELAHPSWHEDDAVRERLRARGLAWVGVDGDDAPEPVPCETAPFGYLRLRRAAYTADALAAWARRIRAAEWRDAFVFFKHEQEGPRLALELLARAARPRPARVPGRKRARTADGA